MGALANAANLLKDSTFTDWCSAGAVYVATAKYTDGSLADDHPEKQLARAVLFSPRLLDNQLQSLLATHPPIANAYPTPGDLSGIAEADVINRITAVWPGIAEERFGPPA